MRLRSSITAIALLATGIAPVVSHAEGATDVAGVPAANVGLHGPVQNHLDNLELVGHTPIPDAAGKPLGNNGGPALIGDCAYVGRWHDYGGRNPIQIIDVGNPAAPTVVGGVPDSVRSGGVSREIRAIDLPTLKVLVVLTFSSGLGDRVNNHVLFFTFPDGDCRHPVRTGDFDMRAYRGHEFFLWLDPDPTHNVDGHPRLLVFVTAPITAPNVMVIDGSNPAGPMLVGVYDAGMPVVSPEEPEGQFLGTYAHSISLANDGSTAYLSYWDGGFFSVDATAFAAGLPAGGFVPKGSMSIPYDYSPGDYGNTHSTVVLPERNLAVTGDEIYITTDGCPFGFMRTIDIGDATTPPSQIGEFRLAENEPENCIEIQQGVDATGAPFMVPFADVRNSAGEIVDGTFSMHNQTVTQNYVVTSWYGAGLRVIDITDPQSPSQAGAFVPKPVEQIASVPATSAPTYGRTSSPSDDWWVQMWSYPVIRDGLIYVTDTRNGLYILRPAPGAPFASEIGAINFLEGNSNLGSLVG